MFNLFEQQAQAASNATGSAKVLRHLLAHLLCEERHTITGLLRTSGRQNLDWSGDYRLYSAQLRPEALFEPIVQGVEQLLDADQPLVVAVDDSTFAKRGKKIDGAGWHRDPLSPPFHTNLIHGMKFVQLSAAVAPQQGPGFIRMIPVAMELIPKLPKLPEDASQEQQARYEEEKQKNSPSAHALGLLEKLRTMLETNKDAPKRPLWLLGDGHYTTSTLLQRLPSGVVYIGRTRGDLHLNAVPGAPPKRAKGRPLAYGEKLPTPEELRKEDAIAWQNATIQKNGKDFTVRYKRHARAKWHTAGEKRIIQVIVVAPFRYRKRKNGPLHYTKPAYLICTDPALAPQQIIQAYIWRWDIEVNFKDEKQLFGLAHAQVRNPKSVRCAPALALAAYAGLHLAALRAFGFRTMPPAVQTPKWRKNKPPRRLTSNDLLRQLRYEAAFNHINFSGFSFAPPHALPPKNTPTIPPPKNLNE